MSIYALAQLGFIAYFGIYMSTNTGGQLGAVKSYIVDFIKSLKPVYYTILIPAIPLALYYILTEKKQTEIEKHNYKKEAFITRLGLFNFQPITQEIKFITYIPFHVYEV